jgi:hypothetical protein
MTALKNACSRATAAPKLPRLPDRIEVEQIEKRLRSSGTSAPRAKEGWDSFLARVNYNTPDLLRPKDLKRLLEELWEDERLDAASASILEHGVGRDRKSIARTIIMSYLRHFPTYHPSFDQFTHASALVANRYDWPWRERGAQWALWMPDQGPQRVSRALLATDDPRQILRDAGLDGDLASGGFAEEAFSSACYVAAGHRGEAAEQSGRRLISLFEEMGASAQMNAPLAYALLAPWTSGQCTEAHQRRVSGMLVSRIGDPRLADARWKALRADVLEWSPGAHVDDAFMILRRWLVRATVHQFFDVVAKTVNRTDQWGERRKFWVAYLDEGLITDAWFAFGPKAERLARKFMDDQTVAYATLVGGGAAAAQSALVFSIGDLRIAEWSDNGRCRFWRSADARAPALYKSHYPVGHLKAMDTDENLVAISHNPPNGWQPKFARHVYKTIGVRHPKHGAGW